MLQKFIETIDFIHPIIITATVCVLVFIGIVYFIEKNESHD